MKQGALQIDISFLMPMYNNVDTVGRALDALLALRHELKYEIIVVNDGSNDGSGDVVSEYSAKYPQIKIISKPNGGQASALNAGLREARGKFLCLAEADVELYPDWLEKTLPEFDDPQVMGVGGHLVTPRDDPWIARIAGYEVESKMDKNPKYVKHITSANAIYRREIFNRVGTYDERMLNSCLDADVNLRIVSAGYRLVYCREARALHHYKTSFFGFMKRVYAYARYRPHLKSGDLYGRDLLLSLQIFLTLLLLLSVPLAVFFPNDYWYAPLALTGLILLTATPVAVKYAIVRRDAVSLLFPFVCFAKNFFGLFGYGIGVINKGLKRY